MKATSLGVFDEALNFVHVKRPDRHLVAGLWSGQSDPVLLDCFYVFAPGIDQSHVLAHLGDAPAGEAAYRSRSYECDVFAHIKFLLAN